MLPLRWTCKSTRKLAEELSSQGHPVSHTTVAQVLEALGYSLQGTRKTQEGCVHPDRNAQFEHINHQVKAFQQRGQPVVSVDAKKKELVGEFANAGREYQPKGQPERVRVYDFVDKNLGKANPYGVYDLTANEGWVRGVVLILSGRNGAAKESKAERSRFAGELRTGQSHAIEGIAEDPTMEDTPRCRS